MKDTSNLNNFSLSTTEPVECYCCHKPLTEKDLRIYEGFTVCETHAYLMPCYGEQCQRFKDRFCAFWFQANGPQKPEDEINRLIELKAYLRGAKP